MVNKILRVVIGIIIAVGLLIGIYIILPGKYKMPLTETIQGFTKSWSVDVINDLKNAKVPNNDMSFGAMLSRYSSPAWTIADDVVDDLGNGSMTVYGDTFDCTVAMASQMADDKNVTFTNAHVRLIFDVKRENGKLTKATLKSVMRNETEYGQDNPYYQLCLDSMCK